MSTTPGRSYLSNSIIPYKTSWSCKDSAGWARARIPERHNHSKIMANMCLILDIASFQLIKIPSLTGLPYQV